MPTLKFPGKIVSKIKSHNHLFKYTALMAKSVNSHSRASSVDSQRNPAEKQNNPELKTAQSTKNLGLEKILSPLELNTIMSQDKSTTNEKFIDHKKIGSKYKLKDQMKMVGVTSYHKDFALALASK